MGQTRPISNLTREQLITRFDEMRPFRNHRNSQLRNAITTCILLLDIEQFLADILDELKLIHADVHNPVPGVGPPRDPLDPDPHV